MESAGNVAYDFILGKIRAGEWTPGTRIYTEEKLCEELSVSRISVRSGLDKLCALGIIKKRKGSGTYVEEANLSSILSTVVPLIALTGYNLRDVVIFRSYFESANIEEFINNDPNRYLPRLEMACEKLDQCATMQERAQADYEFHSVIAKGTENSLIISIHEMLRDIILPALADIIAIRSEDIHANRDAHRIMLNVIKEGDKEMASLLMKRHIQETLALLDGSTVHYFPSFIKPSENTSSWL